MISGHRNVDIFATCIKHFFFCQMIVTDVYVKKNYYFYDPEQQRVLNDFTDFTLDRTDRVLFHLTIYHRYTNFATFMHSAIIKRLTDKERKRNECKKKFIICSLKIIYRLQEAKGTPAVLTTNDASQRNFCPLNK